MSNEIIWDITNEDDINYEKIAKNIFENISDNNLKIYLKDGTELNIEKGLELFWAYTTNDIFVFNDMDEVEPPLEILNIDNINKIEIL